MLLAGYVERFARSLLRKLPLSDYAKTRIWATSIGRPIGRVTDWAYYRSIELALRAVAQPHTQRLLFPPATGYSMLEFGVASGESFKKLLHFRDVWTRRLQIHHKIIAAGFDTFAGMPAPRAGDDSVGNLEGDFVEARSEEIAAFLRRSKFEDFRLIEGFYSESLPVTLPFLAEYPPIFVSIDCDYYSSTMDIFQQLLPDRIPHGCIFYLDDAAINFWSDRSSELRAIREVNEGAFGKHIYFEEYPLYVETGEMRHYRQIWRFINMETADQQGRQRPYYEPGHRIVIGRTDRISPL